MKVTFDNAYSAFQVIAPKGTMISYTATPTALADGVYLVGDDGVINLDEQFLTDTLYLSTEGTDYAVTGGMRVTYPLGDETVIIRAGSSTIPFSKGGKGGGSGGCNYKGTTTTPISNGSMTNPIVIDGEDYTAVFGDIVVYGYTEFVFDGTQWSEFGRPFDTTPTSGSANAVTSDGIYKRTPLSRTGVNSSSAIGGWDASATGNSCFSYGRNTSAIQNYCSAFGQGTLANQSYMMAIGKWNNPTTGDLFNIGNGPGTGANARSNIVEVNSTELNVNGDIKKNNVSLPTPYTTMPTITEAMLGQIAMYVGETTNDYVKGYFYIASSDGAAEPTYSWVSMVDNVPTSGSKNFVSSDGVYKRTPFERGQGSSAYGGGAIRPTADYAFAYGTNAKSTANYTFAVGFAAEATQPYASAIGRYARAIYGDLNVTGLYNNPRNGDIFEVGNGSYNSRSNILEVTRTTVNINGNIQRDGVGIDDYTTTERKIGKWIDGSDLYQRTFDNVTISGNEQWNENILGTSGIEIVDFKGLCKTASDTKYMYPLNYYRDTGITICTCLNTTATDINIRSNMPSSESYVTAARITIQYIKPVANNLSNNIQNASEPNEEPTEGEDMRSEPVEEEPIKEEEPVEEISR